MGERSNGSTGTIYPVGRSWQQMVPYHHRSLFKLCLSHPSTGQTSHNTFAVGPLTANRTAATDDDGRHRAKRRCLKTSLNERKFQVCSFLPRATYARRALSQCTARANTPQSAREHLRIHAAEYDDGTIFMRFNYTSEMQCCRTTPIPALLGKQDRVEFLSRNIKAGVSEFNEEMQFSTANRPRHDKRQHRTNINDSRGRNIKGR